MSYEWVKLDDDLIELRENFNKRGRYNRANLEITITNIKDNKSQYGTIEAWDQRVKLFEAGRSAFDLTL